MKKCNEQNKRAEGPEVQVTDGLKGVALTLSLLLCAGTAYAACTSAPDCASLGYTKTSSNCPNGGVKCPFNTALMFCAESCTYTLTASNCSSNCQNVGTTSCVRNGTTYYASCGTSKCGAGQSCSSGTCVCDSAYQYNCTGTGYAGGAGTSCNSKFTSCNCSSGYTWSGGVCKKTTAPSGWCCNDGSTSCSYSSSAYNYCKQNYGYDDCRQMQASCTASGGTPRLLHCYYYDGNYFFAKFECAF